MISFDSIQSIYENEGLLLDTSQDQEKNLAVDVSSRVRLIKLLDGKFHYNGHELYVPGECYLISFREVEKAVKYRRKVTIDDRNIFPLFVDEAVRGVPLRRLYQSVDFHEHGFFSRAMNEIEEEVENFKKIRENRRKKDTEGLVILQNVNPVTPLSTGYELDGINYAFGVLGKVELPVVIEAEEAEFTYLSDDYAKLSDGDKGIRKYGDGILALKHSSFVIQELDEDIKKTFLSNRLRYIYRDISARIKTTGGRVAYNTAAGLWIGGAAGLIPALIFAGINKLTGSFEDSFFEIFYYGEVAITGFYGAVRGLLGNNIFFGREYEISGDSFMKTAFYGEVKDQRMDNLEKLLASESDKKHPPSS